MCSNRAEPEGTLNATAECGTAKMIFSACSLPTVSIPHEIDPDRDRSRVGGTGLQLGGRQAVTRGRKMMVHGRAVVHTFSCYLTEPPSVSICPQNALSRNTHNKDPTQLGRCILVFAVSHHQPGGVHQHNPAVVCSRGRRSTTPDRLTGQVRHDVGQHGLKVQSIPANRNSQDWMTLCKLLGGTLNRHTIRGGYPLPPAFAIIYSNPPMGVYS